MSVEGDYEVEVVRDRERAELPPSHCCMCGRSLVDALSRETGIGPICAEKFGYGQFVDTPINEEALRSAYELAPQKLQRALQDVVEGEDLDARRIVNKAVYQASVVISYPDQDRNKMLASVCKIVVACGYLMLADRLEYRYLGKDFKKATLKLTRLPDGRIELVSPYNPEFVTRLRNVPGRRWDGMRKVNTVPESSLPQLMQVMSDFYPDQLMIGLDGTMEAIPAVVEFPPPPTPPAPAPKEATGELAWGVEPAKLEKGMKVLDPEGNVRIVGWVSHNPQNPSAGLVKPGQKGYEFIGFNRLRYIPEGKLKASEKAEQEERREEAKRADAPQPAPLAEGPQRPIPAEAFPHQVDGVRWLDRVKSGILGDEPGVGKTFQACVASDARVVVVCPAAMRVEWGREMNRWRPEYRVLVVGGTKPYDQAEYEAADVIVINYDILKDHLEPLLNLDIRTVICDEAQYLKNMKQRGRERELDGSQRAKAVHQLLEKGPEKRFMLTATPIMNRVIELWSLLFMVDPVRWDSYSKFGMRYCNGQLREQVVRGGRRIRMYDFSGASNTAELHSILTSRYMLRRTKDILNLPPKSRRTIMVPLPMDAARSYREAAKDFLKWVKDNGGVDALKKAQQAEALVKLTTLRHFVAVAKVDAAIEWIVNHCEGTGRPLCVFAHHQDVTSVIAERLRGMEFDSPQNGKRRFRVGTIIGGQSEADRTRAKDAFQDGQLDVIVCSIQAAGVGLTLTAASESLFVERAWRPSDLVQAEDRIWRIGSKNACMITYLDAKDTIDELIGQMLVDKAETINAVIDGKDFDEDGAVKFVMDLIYGHLEGLAKNPQGELFGIDWASGGNY